MTILSVHNLTKSYGENEVVSNVSFSLPKGRCIALIGPNGAGKTTTLRMITNLIRPTSGEIRFHNVQVSDYRSFIGYLPQHPTFYPWMTGKEFLVFSAELTNIPKKEAIKRAEQLLKKVSIYEAKDERIGNYSGGMRQRLGIAQAIIHQPKLLILDEPVSALDPIGRRDVLTLMEELKEEMTIIFSTHILSDADEVSDELLLLHKGKLVEAGSLAELRQKYQTAMIELTFEENMEFYAEKIKEFPSVLSISIVRDEIHASVSSISMARAEILTAAVKEKWPIASYAINRTSLEDLFMKVVNDDAMENVVSKRVT